MSKVLCGSVPHVLLKSNDTVNVLYGKNFNKKIIHHRLTIEYLVFS